MDFLLYSRGLGLAGRERFPTIEEKKMGLPVAHIGNPSTKEAKARVQG